MRQIKNRAIFLIYAFFAFFFYLTLSEEFSLMCYAQAQFEINVEFGYDNYVKSEHFIPVTIDCENMGEYFSGEIKVVAADSFYGDPVVYTQTIEIQERGQTEVCFYIPLSFYGTKLSVFLEADYGEEVYSKTFIPNVNISDDVFVGVADEDFEALSYLSSFSFELSDINLENTAMKLFSFDISETSEDMKSLDLLDIIVIDDSDISALNDNQQDTLNYWVSQGGILLTGTKALYQKPDYDVWDYFHGKVISFQFDLSDASFTEQENASEIHDIIAAEFSESDWERIAGMNYSFGYSGLQNTLSNIMPEKIPNISAYVIILIAYIAIFLIIYFVLKKIEKQQYIWISLPITAFLFMMLIFVISGKTRQNDPFLNYVSVVELGESKDIESTFIATTSPKNDAYGFSILNNYEVRFLNDYSFSTIAINYYSTEVLNKDDYKVSLTEDNESTLIGVNNQKAFGSVTFEAEQLLDDVGDINIELTYDGNGYSGTITNNTGYDLSDTGIITPFTALILKDLKSGEILEVYIEDDMYNSGQVYNYNSGEYLIPKTDDNDSEYEAAMQVSKRNILAEFAYSNIYDNEYKTYFVAFTDTFTPQLVADINLNAAGNTLIAKEVNISFINDGVVNYPDASTFVTVLSGDTFKEDFCMYSQEVELAYNFDKKLQIDSLSVNINLLEKMDISVYFYNHVKETYEQIFMDGDAVINDLTPYLDADNQLTVRFVHNSYGTSAEYAKVPSLAISGRME